MNRPTALVALLFLLGCGSSSSMAERADSAPRVVGTGDSLTRYVVLGDSTAVAVGGDYERGIAVETARRLAARRRARVELVNTAVSGATIHDVLTEQLARAPIGRADVVLLIAGANDVTHFTPSRTVERDTRRILDTIQQTNPRARVLVTGAPDMSTAPRIPRLLRPLAGLRSRRLNVMFRREAAAHGALFVPIADETGPLFRRDRTLFSADRFHPNVRGYDTWTAVINRAIDRL